MKIRPKLAWTFIILLIVGIMSISSYSILFIRDYLIKEGRIEMQKDTRWLSVTAANLSADKEFNKHLRDAARTSGYQLALYDSTGTLLHTYLNSDTTLISDNMSTGLRRSLKARGDLPLVPSQADSEVMRSYITLFNTGVDSVQYLQAAQLKDEIYEPIKKIRWIIYYGLFISTGLIVIVSFWIARNLTKPITQIKDAAQDIADGNVDREMNIDRNDEFGILAQALDRMASRLRADTERMKKFAEKQQQFFADITHEVRNPLHTISAALEMLELENLSQDKKQKYIRSANKQTERISRLFKDLKTLQRYDDDEYFVEQQKFDLSDIAQNMEEWYGERVRSKGITFDVDDHACQALGDPAKIEQVIDNLCSNALKYTNEGKVSLRYEENKGEIEISVEDTGAGISTEHLNRLFDRFYRTDKARSRDKGGTGLGLAVVNSILSAHDTDINVESEVGEGTRFWFRLPKF